MNLLPTTPRLRAIAAAAAVVVAVMVLLTIYAGAVNGDAGAPSLRDECIARGVAPALCPG